MSRLFFSAYSKYVHNWEPRPHQEPWYEALQALAEGRLQSNQNAAMARMKGEAPERLEEDGEPTTKLMILAPPGSGKSDTLIEFMAWLIGRETLQGRAPTAGIISYSDEVAEDRSKAIRELIEFSEEYHNVFPNAVPDKKKGYGQKEWFLQSRQPGKKDPTFRAAGMGGGILSFRLQLVAGVDDPHNFQEAYSPTELEMTWRTFNGSIRTRILEWTPLIVISTRLAQGDLAGRIMAGEAGWHIIWTPALFEKDGEEQSYWPPEILPNGMPGGISVKELQRVREVDPVTFTTQYMALPPSATGVIFTQLQQVPTPKPDDIREVRQYWDTSEGVSKDKSAMCEFWRLKDGRLFLNNVFEERLETFAIAQKVTEMFQETDATTPGHVSVHVENRLNGRSIVNFVRAHTPGVKIGLINVSPKYESHKRISNKLIDRAAGASGYCQTGQVVIPEEWRPWKDKFLQQVMGYDGKAPDDIVSAFTLGINDTYATAKGKIMPFSLSWKGY